MDLFNKIKDKELNSTFIELCNEEKYYPAKDTITEIAKLFKDKDGNFVEQFQTNGFDQRLWELLLFAVFDSEKFEIKQEHSVPDFEIVKNGATIFVEATTSNIQVGDPTSDELIKIIKSKELDEKRIEAFDKLKSLYVEKIGSALFSKISKNYQELEWVKNNPILLAISPIHDDFARQNSDSLLITYLYGYKFESQEDTLGNLVKVDYIEKNIFEKCSKVEIPALFNSDESKYISGILFFNDLSVEKFNRIGFINGSQENIIIWRTCDLYDPENSKPKEIFYDLRDDTLNEDWKQGVSIFHNPNALHQIDVKLFEGFRQVWFKDGKLDGIMPEVFPFNSITLSDTLG